MFWIILGIITLILIIFLIITPIFDLDWSSVGIMLFIFVITVVIGFVSLTPKYIDSKSLDEKIMIVQEANEELESEIAVSVSSYMKYEGKEFLELKPDYNSTDIVAFAETYPDLKSSTLIQEQIKTYKENKERIVYLKEEKVETNNTLSFWLFIKE